MNFLGNCPTYSFVILFFTSFGCRTMNRENSGSLVSATTSSPASNWVHCTTLASDDVNAQMNYFLATSENPSSGVVVFDQTANFGPISISDLTVLGAAEGNLRMTGKADIHNFAAHVVNSKAKVTIADQSVNMKCKAGEGVFPNVPMDELDSVSFAGKSYCYTFQSQGGFGQPAGTRKRCFSFINSREYRRSSVAGNPPQRGTYVVAGNLVTLTPSDDSQQFSVVVADDQQSLILDTKIYVLEN